MSNSIFDDVASGPTYRQPRNRMGCGSCLGWGCGCLLALILLMSVALVGIGRFAPGLVDRLRSFVKRVGENSKPFMLAMEKIRAHEELRKRLGEPISSGEFSSWNYHSDGEQEHASFRFPVHGPRGTADVEGKAEWREGEWRFLVLRATLADGTVVDVK